jgi:type IV pilus assembly protein PilV
MVALFVLLIGLLGLAALSLQSQNSAVESYQRNQALLLAQDMVQRINGNRAAVSGCYTTTALNPAFLGTGSATLPNCGAGTSAQAVRANKDLAEWDALLKGSTETLGAGPNNQVGAAIGARGCVTSLGGGLYLVSVAWQGLSDTVAPPAGLTCGTGLYGSETKRRVVSLTVRLAVLT